MVEWHAGCSEVKCELASLNFAADQWLRLTVDQSVWCICAYMSVSACPCSNFHSS